MSLENFSWLLIGAGIGITLGEKNTYIMFFGILVLSTGFAIHYIDERQQRRKKYDSKKSKK
jgi:hypothetical protein